MKQLREFKHKKLGETAIKGRYEVDYYEVTYKNRGTVLIPKEFIEDSNDWEEIPESLFEKGKWYVTKSLRTRIGWDVAIGRFDGEYGYDNSVILNDCYFLSTHYASSREILYTDNIDREANESEINKVSNKIARKKKLQELDKEIDKEQPNQNFETVYPQYPKVGVDAELFYIYSPNVEIPVGYILEVQGGNNGYKVVSNPANNIYKCFLIVSPEAKGIMFEPKVKLLRFEEKGGVSMSEIKRFNVQLVKPKNQQ